MRSTWAILPVVFAVLVTVSTATAGVVADGPAGVLDAYSQVFDGGGVEALESLLASDYDWVVVNQPEVQILSRDDVVTLTRNMLDNDKVDAVDLSFDRYTLEPGSSPDEWILGDVPATLTMSVIAEEGGEPEEHVTRSCMSFYVRRVPGTDSEYEIYREVNFEGVGCESE